MADLSMSKTIVRNTVSNYLRTSVALVAGLLTFRLLYGYFEEEEFGFWALLWSLFGMGVIFDFGLGFAAQKRVAELVVAESWSELSRILSSILFFYIGIAVALPVVVFATSATWIGWIGLPDGREEEFRVALGLFFAGVSLSFPLGIFPEILRGQQKIHVANWLVIAAVSVRLVLVVAGVNLGWSFTTLLLIAIGSTLAPDFCAAFFAFRSLPKIRISPRLFSITTLRSVAHFSVFAYCGILINLALSRTDQLVITASLGVGAIVLYQAGAKIAEMFRDFTRQLQEALSPAAASLNASGDGRGLRILLLEGNRWSALLATPLYLLCAFHLEALITLLTGDRTLARETWLIGQILLIWYYTAILTHSVSRRVFMMTGHERKLTRLGAAEAIANLLLSILLVISTKSVVGVALGSLLPTLYFGWKHYWPWMARESGMSLRLYFRASIAPALSSALAPLIFLTGAQAFIVPLFDSPFVLLAISGSSAGVIAIFSTFFFGLTNEEQHRFRIALSKRIPRLAKLS